MRILQKIRVFDGLSLVQAEMLLQICKFQVYQPKDRIYTEGELSTEMLVLIKGKLRVVSKEGKGLVDVSPGTSTGEMGVFTGARRSAHIVAVEQSAGLAIQKQPLDDLLGTDPNLRATILQNVVDLLSERLAEANQKIDEYAKALEKKEQT